MRFRQLQADRRRRGSFGQEFADGEEVAFALGHLLAFDDEVASVKPVTREVGLAGGAAGLGELTFVMGEDVVFAAGVDVDDAVRALPQ